MSASYNPYQQPAPQPSANLFVGADRRLRPGWRIAIYTVACVILTLVGQLALTLLYIFTVGNRADLLTSGLNSPTMLLLGASLYLPAALIPAYLMWRLIDRRIFPAMGFVLDGRRITLDTLLGLLLGLLAMGAIFIGESVLGWITVREVRFEPLVLLAFPTLLAAAAAEEIAFRGYIYNTAAPIWGVARAAILSMVSFGLIHGGNPNVSSLALLNIIFAGAVFTVQVLATGNLWLPIAFHFSWNFFQGPIFGFPVSGVGFPTVTDLAQSGGDTLITGGAFGPEGGLSSTLVLAVVLLLTLWQIAQKRKQTLTPTPDLN